ncbi:MAG: TonB-dependent receptor plug domain-containing protein, partial [Wohlfahrtiimonas sp.]
RQSSRETRPNSDGAGIEQGWVPPLAAIERIEVVRGPISSRYGSDAMGGVVNIITKKVADKWGGNIRTDFTLTESSDRGNTNTTEFYLAGPLIAETLGLQLYGKHSGREEDKVNKGFPEQRLQNFGGKLSFIPVKGQTFELEAGMGFQKRFSHVGKTIAEFNDKGKRNKDS